MAVYVICHETDDGLLCGPTKVGVAGDPQKRLRQLQTANPRKLALFGYIELPMSCSLELEKHAVQSFRRLRGEWFDVEPKKAWGALSTWTYFSLSAVSDNDPRVGEAVADLCVLCSGAAYV